MKEIEKPWIEEGYLYFAFDGPNGLKIERISKAVGKNKSSFYHLFAELDVFMDKLLLHHRHKAKDIAQKELISPNESALIEVILEHKIDLLFNRQLRFHRDDPKFENCLHEVDQISIPAVLPIWKEITGITESTSLAQMVLLLSLENFYLQITDRTLSKLWLERYFAGIRQMVSQFRKHHSHGSINGGV